LYWSTRQSSLDPDRRAELKPVGSWNEMVIETRGDWLQVWVNGRRILCQDLDRFAGGLGAKPGLRRSSGRIGFQQHTGEVRFRNIEIEELPPPEKQSLFNGKDLTGWVGDPAFWRVEDGVLVGRLPRTKIDGNTFLYSKKTYGDFELRFRARLSEGG